MEKRSGAITGTDTELDKETILRREFLRKVGKATATAPAVALLMAASAKPASAVDGYGACGDSEGGSGSS